MYEESRSVQTDRKVNRVETKNGLARVESTNHSQVFLWVVKSDSKKYGNLVETSVKRRVMPFCILGDFLFNRRRSLPF